ISCSMGSENIARASGGTVSGASTPASWICLEIAVARSASERSTTCCVYCHASQYAINPLINASSDSGAARRRNSERRRLGGTRADVVVERARCSQSARSKRSSSVRRGGNRKVLVTARQAGYVITPSTNRLRGCLPDFLQQVAEPSHRHDFHAAVFE